MSLIISNTDQIVKALQKGPLTIEDLSKTLNLSQEQILPTLYYMTAKHELCIRKNKIYLPPKTDFIDILSFVFIISVFGLTLLWGAYHIV